MLRASSGFASPLLLGLTLGTAALTAWLWAVLLAGRALPWQAERWWALAFAVAFVLSAFWWQRFFHAAVRSDRSVWPFPALLGAGPTAALATIVLGLTYASDQFNALLERPYWHMPFFTAAVLTLVASESVRAALPLSREKGLGGALAAALFRRGEAMALVSLLAIGLLQAAAGVVPIGDDIWHYSEVADALLEGRPYPVTPAWTELIRAGSGAYYPALPVLPALLAISFTLFGRNLVGIALPNVAAIALFPLAFYAACKGITGSRPTAYVFAVVLYLFPIYQIHILGSAEPDTIFVTLMLLGAAFAAKANSEPGHRRWWIGMGATMGLASLTRHEGAAFSAVLFATFLVVHRVRANFWLSVATYLAVLCPFIAVYHSRTGELWPRTFGTGVVSFQNLLDNLNNLNWASLPWYAQAVGIGKETLVGLLLLGSLVAVLGTLGLARKSPALAGVPLAGIGFSAAGLTIHQNLVYSAFPVEFLRHLSFGIPFATIGVAYAVSRAFRWGRPRFERSKRWLLLATLLIVSGVICYEADRLARPEYYFDGRSSLLWTGDFYLLTDVWRNPVQLPAAGDARGGEQIREEMTKSLDGVDLRLVNLSEPYHWATMILAVFGLVYALAPPFCAIIPPQSGSRPTVARGVHHP